MSRRPLTRLVTILTNMLSSSRLLEIGNERRLSDLQERRQLTYIFVSHDLSVVKFMADMMAVMYEGKFVEFGVSEEIYAHPKQEYTKRLIEATPDDNVTHIRRRLQSRTTPATD